MWYHKEDLPLVKDDDIVLFRWLEWREGYGLNGGKYDTKTESMFGSELRDRFLSNKHSGSEFRILRRTDETYGPIPVSGVDPLCIIEYIYFDDRGIENIRQEYAAHLKNINFVCHWRVAHEKPAIPKGWNCIRKSIPRCFPVEIIRAELRDLHTATAYDYFPASREFLLLTSYGGPDRSEQRISIDEVVAWKAKRRK